MNDSWISIAWPIIAIVISIFSIVISIFSFYYNFLKGSDIICIPEIKKSIFNKLDEKRVKWEITGDCVFANKGNKAGIIKDLRIFPAFNNCKKLIIKSRTITENENSNMFQVGIKKVDIFERILNWKRKNMTVFQSTDKKIFSLTGYKSAPYRAFIPYSFDYNSEFKLINGVKLELPLIVADKELVYTSFVFSIDLNFEKYKKYKNKLSVTGMIISYNNIKTSKIINQNNHCNFDFTFNEGIDTDIQ